MAQSLNDKKEFISRIIELLATDTKLTAAKHQQLFDKLQTIIPSSVPVSPERLNHPQTRKDLMRTLQAMLEATIYPLNVHQLIHHRHNGSKVTIIINNRLIYKNLSEPLSFTQFKKLFKLCRNHGVFDLVFENHIPVVTLQAGSQHMTRKWPRDHAGMLPLINAHYPQELAPGLLAWAKAYTSPREISSFEKVIANPETYLLNQGISHIFWLEKNGNLKRDENWQMNQRLESHSELLNAFVSYLSRQLQSAEQKETYFTPEIIKAVVYFTHYLFALGISPASCGPWEEIPFSKGINWDCASMVLALKKVVELMVLLQFHPKQLNKFLSFEKKLCTKLNISPVLKPIQPLKDLCHQAIKIIRDNYKNEFRNSCNRVDACSIMLAASDLELSRDNELTKEIKLKQEILTKATQHLVGEFGARRYSRFAITIDDKNIKSCDSYLNLNSDIMVDNHTQKLDLNKRYHLEDIEKNSGDASGIDEFIKRNQDCTEDTSAQWGLPLSYAALAYSKMLRKLLELHRITGNLKAEETDLLKQCHNSAEEFIKRSYGNITGIKIDGALPRKANGEISDIWKKPEAYQAVSTLRGNGDFAFLPGVNSHLGWDAAVCYSASEIFLSCLEYMETNHLN